MVNIDTYFLDTIVCDKNVCKKDVQYTITVKHYVDLQNAVEGCAS